MRWLAILVLLIVLLIMTVAGCAETPEPPAIQIENARLKPPAPGQTTAVVYFDIFNKGGVDTLLSVTAPVSANIELHNHLHENGITKMRKIEQVEIPAHSTISFKPGGLHVMMFDAELPLGQDFVHLTLSFTETDDINLAVEVLGF